MDHFHIYLVRQLVFHVLLDAAQHERLQDHVQSGELVWNRIAQAHIKAQPEDQRSLMNISLEVHPTQKRNNNFPQNRETEAGLTLIDGRFVLSVALDVFGEPLVELFVGIEQRGHDEVQQGPQLRDGNDTPVSDSL